MKITYHKKSILDGIEDLVEHKNDDDDIHCFVYKRKIVEEIIKEKIPIKIISRQTDVFSLGIADEEDAKEKKFVIYMPIFTSGSVLEQTYSLAHELGHAKIYLVDDDLEKLYLKILDNVATKKEIYENESAAWEEAEKILINLDIPLEYGESSFADWKAKCLNSYAYEEAVKNSTVDTWNFTDALKECLVIPCAKSVKMTFLLFFLQEIIIIYWTTRGLLPEIIPLDIGDFINFFFFFPLPLFTIYSVIKYFVKRKFSIDEYRAKKGRKIK